MSATINSAEKEGQEAFSIQDLLRQNNRERLFVQPLHWTSRHVTLLDLRFHRKRRNTTTGPAINHQQPFSKLLQNTARELLTAWLASTTIMHEILQLYGLGRCNHSELVFRFGQNTAVTVNTDGLFFSRSSNPTPILAYLDGTALRTRRLATRPPTKRRQQHPSDPEDPYITATLIALAQAQHPRGQTCLEEVKVG